MQHKGTQVLQTPRLTLRPFVMKDAEAAFRNWTSDDEVTRFLRWPAHKDITVTESVLADWIARYADPAFYQWAILPRDLGEPIGTISVVGMNERTQMVHIGYCIGRRWWRMGYTTEAFRRIIPFLFQEVGVQRIESQHDPDNPGSGRVMLKCGLRYEGTLRQADWSNRGVVDACMYAILKEDFTA